MSISDKIIKNPKSKRLNKDDLRPTDFVYVEDVRLAVNELKSYITAMLKKSDKESAKCMKCRELEYCKEHMVLYRRIEDIYNYIDKIFGEGKT